MNNVASLPLGLTLAGLLGLSLTAFDCGGLGKDESKCKSAQDGLRLAIKYDDRAATDVWRKYAYSQCSDKELLSKLDQEITQGQSDADRRRSEKKKADAEKRALLDLFTRWAGETRTAPQAAAGPLTCEGTEAEAKTQERWCSRTRQAGTYSFELRYRDKEPQAVRFSTTPPFPATCADLGASREIRSWTVQGNIKRHHCEITGGPAAGMQAMVTEALAAPMLVFSPRFVELDPGFQSKLVNEGR